MNNYKYPNASFMWNAKEFLCSSECALMSLEELGEFYRKLDLAALNGDFSYLKQFSFIGRIYKGTSKRESIPPSIRKEVLSIGLCAYCGSIKNLQVDHIIPYSKGGTHDRSNLQCLCFVCNRAKSDLTEEEYFLRLENV